MAQKTFYLFHQSKDSLIWLGVIVLLVVAVFTGQRITHGLFEEDDYTVPEAIKPQLRAFVQSLGPEYQRLYVVDEPGWFLENRGHGLTIEQYARFEDHIENALPEHGRNILIRSNISMEDD